MKELSHCNLQDIASVLFRNIRRMQFCKEKQPRATDLLACLFYVNGWLLRQVSLVIYFPESSTWEKEKLGTVARSVDPGRDNPWESLAPDPADDLYKGKPHYEHMWCLFMFILTFAFWLMGTLVAPVTKHMMLPLVFYLKAQKLAVPTSVSSLLHCLFFGRAGARAVSIIFTHIIPKKSTGALFTEHKAESLICSFWYNIFGWCTA